MVSAGGDPFSGSCVPRLNDAARMKTKTEVMDFIRTMAEIFIAKLAA